MTYIEKYVRNFNHFFFGLQVDPIFLWDKKNDCFHYDGYYDLYKNAFEGMGFYFIYALAKKRTSY